MSGRIGKLQIIASRAGVALIYWHSSNVTTAIGTNRGCFFGVDRRPGVAAVAIGPITFSRVDTLWFTR